MDPIGRLRAAVTRRDWPIRAVPAGLLTYLLVVDTGVLFWCGLELSRPATDARSWWVLLLLAVLAFGFEEGAALSARLRFRLSADLKRDMSSVWAVASAVALKPAQAVLLLGAVLIYIWRRQNRHVGQPLYRAWFAASSQILGCLTAGLVVHAQSHFWDSLPWALAGSISVIIAIPIQTTINRGLVTMALVGVGVRGRVLLGSGDDNLIELATLCLGGLVALAALHEPWLCILVIAPMVTLQRGALVHELETAATTDSKTGLLNAIAWEHLASRELARAARNKYQLAVLLIDIDRFKLVNDRFGHLAGDVVLRGVGRGLEGGVREFDAVGRFGGEEFVVVLPEAGDVEALIVAERLRSRVNELWVSAMVEGVEALDDEQMSVSIGVACSPTDGVELADLLMAADGALYAAKANGRNRVMLANRGTGQAVQRVTHS
jgi:diguanylate cyclase (GGDEF)-like protein